MVISWLSAFADVPEPRVEAALRFWAAVTAAVPAPPVGDQDEYLPLAGADEDRYLWVQRVHRPDGGWHPDLHVPDLASAARQAGALGATVVHQVPGLIVLDTPAGQPFCLVQDERERRRARPRRWPAGQHSLLDQICLDIPADAFDTECEFWAGLTGWPRRRTSDEFVNLARPAHLPLRILLQRLGSDDAGPTRAHADLACDDRPAEVERHTELGAELILVAEHWTTLRDPAGLVYCVTDRDPFRD
ncbi:VOC family protein [Jatrophihabitans sp.]|uniref:VOC family protein n=1 Tax=Jatrophihabitans sp. TaxID=1932789 RepID=UPI002CAC2149|nr:VOC family protein [Jatrophihabitans sp.]